MIDDLQRLHIKELHAFSHDLSETPLTLIHCRI